MEKKSYNEIKHLARHLFGLSDLNSFWKNVGVENFTKQVCFKYWILEEILEDEIIARKWLKRLKKIINKKSFLEILNKSNLDYKKKKLKQPSTKPEKLEISEETISKVHAIEKKRGLHLISDEIYASTSLEEVEELKKSGDKKMKIEKISGLFDLSGMGGSYEKGCQNMLQKGFEWLCKHPKANLKGHTYKGIYGIFESDSKDAKELSNILAKSEPDCTGAMHQCIMGHLFFIAGNGIEKWKKELEELKKSDEVKR